MTSTGITDKIKGVIRFISREIFLGITTFYLAKNLFFKKL